MTVEGDEELGPEEGARRASDIRFSLHLLRSNPLVVAGIIISVGTLVLSAASGFIVNPGSWQHYQPELGLCWNNPVINWGFKNIFNCGGKVYTLGTDLKGRDLLSMIILAIPTDVEIALEVVASAVAIGVVFGAVAGYAGGLLDEFILRLTDVFLSIPVILLALVLVVVLEAKGLPVSLSLLTLALVVTWWPVYVRLVRSQVLSEKERPYVESLRAMGASRTRILFLHVIPNSIYPLLVQATLDIGSVILTVSALIFIGLTPNPYYPELGNLVNMGIQHLAIAPWLVIFPGLTIFIISLGFNLLGDGIRDVFDPRLRR
ncbi:MAG TPA: ABC transporter permease [Nitrososphaerales archaeon]|nr:ABC transporter permease [Nitrososphaerales archaeon]